MAVSDLLLNILSRSDKRGLTEAADELDKLGRKADDAGEKLGGMAKESGHVDEQITKTKAKIRELGEEFDKTGSKELLPQLRRERGGLAALEKIKKDLTQTITDAGDEGGKGLIAKLGSTLSGGLSGLSGAGSGGLTQYLAIGAAAAAPAIGAAINAGVLLGVGGGGLAAGIIAAAQDERVKSAWTSTINDIKSGFTAAAGPLVAPLVNGAQKVESAFGRMLPGIQQGMAKLAPVVDRLVDGVVGLVEKAGPGFGRAFDASLPLLKQVGAELPKLGSALSSFFDSMARGGPGAVMFFHDLMTAVDVTVVSVGKLVEWLSKAYEKTHDIPGLSGMFQLLGSVMSDSGDKGKKAGGDVKKGMDDAAQGADHASGSIDKATKSLSDWITQTFHAQDNELALQKGLFEIGKAFDQNGASLDITTEKGLANREAMQRQIETLARWRQEQLDSGKAPADVNAALDQQIQKMYDDARAHGANKGQLDLLIGSWRTILQMPSSKTIATNVVTYHNDIYGVTYTSSSPSSFFHGLAEGGMRTAGGIRMAAAGMFIPPSDPGTVLTGEPQTGGEWLIPAQGISTGRAAMLGNAALGNYGLDVVPRSSGYASPVMAGGGGASASGKPEIHIHLHGSARALMQDIATEVRGAYGGDVQVALGGAV